MTALADQKAAGQRGRVAVSDELPAIQLRAISWVEGAQGGLHLQSSFLKATTEQWPADSLVVARGAYIT